QSNNCWPLGVRSLASNKSDSGFDYRVTGPSISTIGSTSYSIAHTIPNATMHHQQLNISTPNIATHDMSVSMLTHDLASLKVQTSTSTVAQDSNNNIEKIYRPPVEFSTPNQRDELASSQLSSPVASHNLVSCLLVLICFNEN